MEQDPAVSKVLRDLIQFELIKGEDAGKARVHLNRLYVAGWEERGKSIGKNIAIRKRMPVIQLDKNYKIIEEYPTARIAARDAHYNLGNIYKYIKSQEITPRGHHWQYR